MQERSSVERELDSPVDIVVDEQPNSVEKKTKLSCLSSSKFKNIARVVSCLPGALSGIPFARPSYQFGSRLHPVLGVVFASSIVISAGSFATWGISNAVEELLLSDKKSDNKFSCKQVFYPAIISAIGVITLLPSAYVGYIYNDEELLWPFITFFADSGVRIYSLHKFYDNHNPGEFIRSIVLRALSGLRLTSIPDKNVSVAKLQKLSQSFVQSVQAILSQKIILQPDVKGLNLIEHNEGIITFNGKWHDLVAQALNEYLVLQKTNKNAVDDFLPLDIFSKCIGLILASSLVFLDGYLAFYGSKLIYDNFYFNVFLAAIAVAPLSYIQYFVIDQQVNSALQYGHKKLTCSHKPGILQQIHPVITTFRTLGACVIGLFAFGPPASIIIDNFQAAVMYTLLALVITGVIILMSGGMLNLSNDLHMLLARNKVVSLKNNFLALKKIGSITDLKIQEFIDVLNNSDNEDIKLLLLAINETSNEEFERYSQEYLSSTKMQQEQASEDVTTNKYCPRFLG